MKKYLGVKMVEATPMKYAEFCAEKGRTPEAGIEPTLDGYKVKYSDGYISWSPEEIFEDSYRDFEGLTFGLALEALKMGMRVARKGWNGKGMFLFLLPAGKIPMKAIHDPQLKAVLIEKLSEGGAIVLNEDSTFDALGSIRMFTADKKVLTGWLASQTDMLSEDWEIVN